MPYVCGLGRALGLAALAVAAAAASGGCTRLLRKPSQLNLEAPLANLEAAPADLDAASLQDGDDALQLLQRGAGRVQGPPAAPTGASALQVGDWNAAAARADAWLHSAARSALEAAQNGTRKGAALAQRLGEAALAEADKVRTAVFVEEGHAESLLRAVHAEGALDAPHPDGSAQSELHADAVAAPWGLDLSAMDPAKTPGEDFYGYINGAWLERTEIPADMSRWSAFDVLNEQARKQVLDLLEDGAKKGSLAGTLYAAYMNETRVEELGLEPLQPLLERVKAIKDAKSFAAYAAATNFGFGRSPFSFGVGADPKDPSMNIAMLDQSGLGLPSRDYYLRDSFAKQREAYGAHVARMLRLVGWPDAEAAGASVLDFETKIADRSWPVEEMRDPIKTYNKLNFSELPGRAPGFDWATFGEGLGAMPGDAAFIVGALDANASRGVPGIAALLGRTEPALLRAWAAFHMASQAADLLPKAITEADFDFYGKVLSGQLQQKPRWKRAVSSTNSLVPDAIGKEYVAKYFPESAKARMEELTSLLKEAFKSRLEKASWMTEGTRAKALGKLASFTFEIGSPRKFRDYSGVAVDADDLMGSSERAVQATAEFWLQQRGKPVDPAYWSMPPQVVNAFFEPTRNRCVFLAAILQPPFFDPNSDMAVNFGGIGAVIGHEMTHGFDDQGRRYDAEGKLQDWWSHADEEEFSKRAEAYGEQFANFTSGLPAGTHIKPGLTMGENIADLGGVTISLDAYRLWLSRQAAPSAPIPPLLAPDADGLEEERRFFAGWAQVWRGKSTEAALRRQLVSDPHSPSHARGTVPLQNLDAWHRAFGILPGTRLFLEPSQRVKIW